MKKYANIALSVLIILTVLVVAACTIYNINIGPVSKNSELKEIVIEDGESFLTIAPLLKENNLIKSELFYKVYIKLFRPDTFEAGIYYLSENMGVAKIVKEISQGSNSDLGVINITFVEGKNMRNIASTIASNTNNTEQEVVDLLEDEEYIDSLIKKYWFLTDEIKGKDIYYPLEGYLFPDTYEFINKNVTVKEIFETMLDNTALKLEPYKLQIQNSGYTVHQVVALASIVELEGAGSDDRASVAGVFYNRLKYGYSLGSDITGYYGAKMDDWSNGLGEHVDDCNGYNTRGTCVAGLPVGPVCNPGIESIEATLNPTQHNYFYFVADCSGKTYLNYNYDAHVQTINTLISEGNWCDK